MSGTPSWTQEATDLCKQYWIDGMSASLIASRMGISRNAVIGKMHRLGLTKCGPRRAKMRPKQLLAIQNTLPLGRPRKPKISPFTGLPVIEDGIGPRFAMPVPQADDKARVSLADLEPHHCRFIPGEPSDGYCGLDRVPGSSYCAGHLQRCYVAVQRTRQMAAHDRVSGQETVAAAAEEFLVPA
jgi:GcrA cell cycle regulator